MSEPISVESMVHKGEKRIKLMLPYQQAYIDKVKQIEGRKWSQSKKCWHLPYSKASFEALKVLFAGVEIRVLEKDKPEASIAKKEESHPTEVIAKQDSNQVKLVITPKKLFVQLPKQEADIKFLRNLHYARWNTRTYLWEISRSEQNLQLLRNYFSTRLHEQELSSPESLIVPEKKHYRSHELTIASKERRLRLMFAYDQKLITFIKKLPYPKYDEKNRWWSVADTPMVRADLEKYCQDHGWRFHFTEISPLAQRKAKISK